ncbi:helix-turn-helix transcriptional regulator [Microbacterium sp. NPDC028030]|uniref:helix-turn-helix transcriptional regulator n=1 Tax=Microbacterium sp. NPDC028030 TaxID=3155124 RepID=UPI0033EDFB2F
MSNREEVRDFLTTRRARITPEQVGIQSFGTRRRVTGLRREEVALLAGVSVDYYTRLERGNLSGTSDSILTAIAHALSLDDAEREHLFDMARHQNDNPRRPTKTAPVAAVRPELQYLLDSIRDAPATIANNRMDILAANDLGYAMNSEMFRGTLRPANHSRFIFLDPRAADFYPDWNRAANINVQMLRREAGRSPHDAQLASLVGELSMRSDEFRARWAAHDVRHHYTGMKQFRHPVIGLLELTFQTLELEGDPGLSLTVYPAIPDSPSAEGLKLLASWAATENIADRARHASV